MGYAAIFKESVPLKRLGSEAEVSAAICFLLSEAAAFITGAVLQVDGGAPLASAVWPMLDHDRSRPFEGFHRGRRPAVLDDYHRFFASRTEDPTGYETLRKVLGADGKDMAAFQKKWQRHVLGLRFR